MCDNNCLIPTPATLPAYYQHTTQNQVHFNIYDQTALNVTQTRNNPQTTKYNNTTRTESRDMRTPQGWERPTTGRFQEIDTRRTDMRRWAILDSGASSHFLMMDAPLLYKRKTTNPVTVTVANGGRVRSTHDGALDIPGLPPRARYAHVIPGIRHLLLSIVRLCNAGCEVIFGRWGLNVEVRHKGKMIMRAKKSTINGLWYVPITNINKKDNLQLSNNRGVNPDQQEQETTIQATQRQARF